MSDRGMREETLQTGKSSCGARSLHNTNPFKKNEEREFIWLSHLPINYSLVIPVCYSFLIDEQDEFIYSPPRHLLQDIETGVKLKADSINEVWNSL